MDRMTFVTMCCPLRVRKRIARAAIMANMTTSAWLMQAAGEKLGFKHRTPKRGRPRKRKI